MFPRKHYSLYICFHGNKYYGKMNEKEAAPVIIGKLMNIGGMLERKANRMLLPFSLNHQQFSILFEIGKAGKVKQKEMVNRLALERSHVSKVIKKLQDMGLLNISDSTDDKRSALFSLTATGKKVLSKCSSIFTKWNEEWIGEMDETIYMSVLENLTTLQTILKEKTR